MMLTYNALLFVKRNELKISRRKMAKKIGISSFAYSLIEKGYVKPTKKQVEKISKVLDIEYSSYLVNEPSYPAELPEKEKMKITKWFYRVIGHIAFKITFIVITLGCLGVMISGIVMDDKVENHARDFYNEDYTGFIDRLRENGEIHLSVIGSLTRPEYKFYEKDTENKTSKYISIVGSYEENSYGTLTFTATYRDEESRTIIDFLSYTLGDSFYYSASISYLIYQDAETFSGSTFFAPGETSFTIPYLSYLDAKGGRHYIFDIETATIEEKAKVEKFNTNANKYLPTLESDFESLISDKDPLFRPTSSAKTQDLMTYHDQGQDALTNPTLYALLATNFGVIFAGLNLFIVFYAFIYGTSKGVVKDYRPVRLSVPLEGERRMKSDIKFAPFVPETLLEIVGIILVFLGSLRIVMYVSSFFDGTIGSFIVSGAGTSFMQTFMVGMFLLYFIDFDIFLDDKRVFRSIVMYTIIFFCLYALENMIMNSLNSSSVAQELVINYVALPNMFGSIACYYLIMLFLFYTPKFIKNKKHLITYRCMSIIPTLIIFVTWIIHSGYNVLYEANWPIEVRNLFNTEKISFSLLCVSYLFGLYFLRLFFEKKYGKEKAEIFFNGNRFLWIKNIMVSLIVLIIGLFELLFSKNLTANKMGIGLYWNIIFLIPLLLVYHPHKGPRNLAVDWTTMALYIFAISVAYIAVVFIALLSLIM